MQYDTRNLTCETDDRCTMETFLGMVTFSVSIAMLLICTRTRRERRSSTSIDCHMARTMLEDAFEDDDNDDDKMDDKMDNSNSCGDDEDLDPPSYSSVSYRLQS